MSEREQKKEESPYKQITYPEDYMNYMVDNTIKVFGRVYAVSKYLSYVDGLWYRVFSIRVFKRKGYFMVYKKTYTIRFKMRSIL